MKPITSKMPEWIRRPVSWRLPREFPPVVSTPFLSGWKGRWTNLPSTSLLTETMENFRLYSGVSPQPRARRTEIVSTRTATLLAQGTVVAPGSRVRT